MNFRVADFDVLRAVRQVRQPVLFIGSGRDVRMPNETVLESLYAAAPSPLKRKFIVPEASHGRASDADPAGYQAAVLDFLKGTEAAAR